ncbi:MAG: outer membrane beta-barrel protein, partial [Myxococcota bacterium]
RRRLLDSITIPNTVRSGVLVFLVLMLLSAAMPLSSAAQDWRNESDDNWYQPTVEPDRSKTSTNWSFRTGIGFIDDPNALQLNFEAPYALDEWISIGPMLQIGIDDNNTIVAPTMNFTVTIPDLPGEDFDYLKPFALAGMGLAYIEDDNRQNDNSSVGFLINFGVGVEIKISEKLFIGSQMMFNFLPETTLGENFFYSWQVGGIRIAF